MECKQRGLITKTIRQVEQREEKMEQDVTSCLFLHKEHEVNIAEMVNLHIYSNLVNSN